jgi:hypothetical protein
MDDSNANAAAGKLQLMTQHFRHSAHGEFTGRISALARRPDKAKDTGDIDNLRGYLLFQYWKKSFHHANDRPEINVHKPFKLFQGNLLERSTQGSAGVVDQDSDAAMLCAKRVR